MHACTPHISSDKGTQVQQIIPVKGRSDEGASLDRYDMINMCTRRSGKYYNAIAAGDYASQPKPILRTLNPTSYSSEEE